MRITCLRLALLTTVAFSVGAQEPAAKMPSPSGWSANGLDRGWLVSNQVISETDKGCCLIKSSPFKASWDWTDGDTRANCAKKASDAGLKASQFEFYKDQKCDDVKKKQ